MCLYISRYHRKDKKTFLSKNKSYIRCYKIMQKTNGYADDKLASPYFYTIYEIGVNVSDRNGIDLSRYEIFNREVNCGIHVFMNKEDAFFNCNTWEVVVPVYCKAKNLVAVGEFNGYPSAVFTEITIQKRDYGRAIERIK